MKNPSKRARTLGLTLALAAALLVTATALPQDSASPSAVDLRSPGAAGGQSETLLPNGQILQIGGYDATGALLTSGSIQNPENGTVMQLASRLRYARAWHTATMLPDGTVAIIGGAGKRAKSISTVERFDPDSQSFSVLNVAGITARSHHTATLLSDGTVLIVGGLSTTRATLGDAQLWNPRTGQVTSVSGGLNIPRWNHNATLESDGTVLIQGGKDTKGHQVKSDESYDPTLQKFSLVPAKDESTSGAEDSANATPELAGTIPENGAKNVSTDTMISLRFSQPMQVETLNTSTIVLASPTGSVSTTVVAAEGGRLVFVNPQSQLALSATYTVTVSGAVGTSGVQMPNATIKFTTSSGGGGSGGVPTGPTKGPGGSGSQAPGVWIPTSDWYTHLTASRWQSLPPLRAPRGVTALSGQVLTIDGSPLANVTLQVGAYLARSDGTGRFLIVGLPAGLDTLLIDGTSANHGGLTFGIFQPGVSVTAKVTNVLPFTIWMPVLDVAHAVTVPSPTVQETVVSNPLMPGLDLHIPAGTVITDIQGKVARTLTMTAVPLDRPPFPLPAGVKVPIYFTIQPGGAQLWTTNGKWAWARLIYPNMSNLPANTPFSFWNYEADEGWYVYGKGRVTTDGSSIVPDPGVGIWKFTGAMVGQQATRPQTNGCQSASPTDPVDCASGIFIHSERDFHLPDVIPLDFTRTYLSQDNNTWPFGIGTSDSYEIYLTGDKFPYTYIDVILPDGQQVHYTNIADQNYWVNTYYVPKLANSSFYYGSTITWKGDGWSLRLKNGTTYLFPDSSGASTPAEAALIGITDRNGNRVTISRNSPSETLGATSHITRITSPNGRWISLQYDSKDRVKRATDNLGRIVTYTYDNYSASGRPTCDSQGMLCAVKDANGGITSYTYDGGNRMLTVTDPLGHTQITNTYDSTSDRVASQTLADGTSQWQYSYTLSGGVVTQTDLMDPNGNVERKEFDSKGFVTADTHAHGVSGLAQEFDYTRDPGTELITSVIDPLDRETSFGYDANGNITSVTRLAGTSGAVTTSLAYDPNFSQITSITDPLSHTWTFGRDGHGNLTSITDPLNHSVSLTYDSEGRPLTVADAYSDTAQFGYNGGDLASITDPLGHTTNRYTDTAGRLFKVVDALGQSTLITRDALDRITQITDPNLNSSSFSYDADSNLLSVTDANSNQTSYTYDSRNRRTSRADGLRIPESYGYDANGNVISYTDRRGKVTALQYDALNRRKFAGFGQSGSSYESTISYSWDGGNRLTGATDSIAGAITRVPDLLDRLTSETTAQGSITYGYDNGSRRTTMQVTGQPQVSYAWDNANRLTGITQGGSSVGINYDNANRRTSLTLPNGVAVGYSVDNNSRITGLTYSVGSTSLGNLTYGYDAAGRTVSKAGSLAATGRPEAVSGNTFNADNGMTGFGGVTLSYDANGNLTSDGTNTYTWDARNHLTAISGAVTASFTYDAFGRRASKISAGTTTQFLYDQMNTVQELNRTGGVVANLLAGPSLDEYFTRTDLTTSVFIADALGSTVGLVDSSGSIATSYTYEPFGATSIGGSASSNTYQFTGRENDGAGLYFYRARYYSSSFQRFIAQDPIGFTSNDANLYGYVFNNPMDYSDPLGLFTGQIGVNVNVTGGDGVIGGGGSISIGIVFDGHGNVGLYITPGVSVGTGNGVSASAGVDLQWSNGDCIKDISGPFLESVGTVGGIGGYGSVSGDGFAGQGSHGQLVVGGGGVIGVGEGVSGQGAYTSTTVIPWGNIWNVL
jgi:RHS repeat-associated protein